MRTIIEVPDDVIKHLDDVGRQEKKSRAAVVCEAIQMYLSNRQTALHEAAFGIWKGKNQDGLNYQREIRTEWI